MKVAVDNDMCQGHGRCNAVAPDVFKLDDSGYIDFTGELEVEPEFEEQARHGVASCPENALKLVEE